MKVEISETGRTMAFEVSIDRDDVGCLGDEFEAIIDAIFSPLTDDSTFDEQWLAVCAFVAAITSAQRAVK